jgi:uncharacterized protein involved in exopolysaccharide biosynthesis
MNKNNNTQHTTSSNANNPQQPQFYALPPGVFPNQLENNDDEIDLKELWHAIWAGKKLIIAITFVFALSSVFYALSLPNIYKASVVLAPASDSSGAGGLSRLAGQFGGLASLAGINLGGGNTDKTGIALEVLKSRQFIENFINKHNLLVPLMAVKKWDIVNDKLIYDDEIYNIEEKKWVRDVKFPKTPKPSNWEAFKAFSDILAVSKDKESGMVTLSIDYYSPQIAIEWLTWLVKDINTTMRDKDKTEAQNSIDFLSKKLEQTQLADMQKVFYQLIEEQTKTIMLAEVSDEYVLKTIDPANSPDEKAKPKRALIVVLATMLGGMLSVLIVLVRYFSNKE